MATSQNNSVSNSAPNIPPASEGIRPLAYILNTLQDAVASPNPYKGTTYEILGKRVKSPEAAPELTSANSAIYIGKLFPPNLLKEIPLHTFGFETDEKIYGPLFIRAALDYGFKHTAPGEKVKIVVCRALSELLNGRKDTEGTYTEEEEINLLYGEAFLTAGRAKARTLEVITMDQVPDNISLFEKLRAAQDPTTKIVDIEKAYGTENSMLSENPSALEITQFLYAAAQKNPRLKEAFFKMRPAKVRENNDYPESSKYYGLTEIAIRLRAILSGQYIHMGVERQGVYDKMISEIVRGHNQKGLMKDVTELYPLYDLFAGENFETVHINTKTNIFKQKASQKLAMSRAFIWGSVMNCLLLGGGLLNAKMHEEKTAAVIKQIEPLVTKNTPSESINLPTNPNPTADSIPSQKTASATDKTPSAESEFL